MQKKGGRQSLITAAVIITVVLAALPFVIPHVKQAIIDAKDGDVTAVSGLILTVGGFVITLWQLLRTKAASRAAIDAVDNLKFRLAGLEDTAVCRDCLGAAGEIERQHIVSISVPSLQSYVVLPEIYRALRLHLMTFRARRVDLWSPEHSQVAQEAMAKLEDAEQTVLRFISNPQRQPPNLQPLQTSIRRLSEVLTLMSVTLSKVAIGEPHDER